MDAKYVEMEREMSVRAAIEWIDNAVVVYERAVRETNSYRSRFLDAVAETNAKKENATAPAEILSWLVMSTGSVAGNLRLDMAVKHGISVSEAYRKVRALSKEVAAAGPKTHTLTGVSTVLPTLKSARAHCDRVRPPVLIHVGTLESCFERAMKLNGGRTNCTIEEWHRNQVPVVVTENYTYHVAANIATDDYEV